MTSAFLNTLVHGRERSVLVRAEDLHAAQRLRNRPRGKKGPSMGLMGKLMSAGLS
jgi:hypothetical protein